MKAVLVYSGGLDSTVLLYRMLGEGHVVLALSVDYGQRHRRELDCARAIALECGARHEVADLSALARLLPGNSLTDRAVAVPHGPYTEATMKSTIVPNRNMILLSVAAAWAIAERADCVAYAAHGGDHAVYPDCREGFARALDGAIRLADWHSVSLHRPFVGLEKSDLVRMGAEWRVPFERTWSCYEGGAHHCGRCGTCVERREAFLRANVSDPTVYAPDAPSPALEQNADHGKESPC